MKGLGQLLEHWGANIPEKDFNFGIRLFYNRCPKQGEPKISLEEFIKESVYFLLQSSFSEMKPRLYPTKPRRLQDYDTRKATDEDFEIKDSFWRQPEIQSYICQKSRIEHQNKSNLYWLKWLLRQLERYGDVHYAQIVRSRIQEFEDNPRL